MCGEEEQRMVLQIAAHAAQVGNDVDAECAQLRRRANSCAQQKGGEWMAQPHSTISAPWKSRLAPSTTAATPLTRRPSNKNRVTVALVIIVRFLRPRTLASR